MLEVVSLFLLHHNLELVIELESFANSTIVEKRRVTGSIEWWSH